MHQLARLPLALSVWSLANSAYAQQVGTNQAENHPRLTVKRCTSGGGCTSRQQSVVLDANWRWSHNVGGSTNCYTGNTWNTQLCPDPTTCARNCAVDGADYAGTYGVTTSGDALTLKFVTQGPYSTNIGSRVYLLDTDDTNYQQFNLLNQEFAFDVDVSNLPCGLNGALYFAQLPRDGGMSQFSGNRAGAKYGTGYCDAQCPHDVKFINGEANVLDWKPSDSDANAGTGRYGSCCAEMDIWESNKYATAYTTHACSNPNQFRCSGSQCGDGSERYSSVCDKDGCDFNSFRLGNESFFGPGSLVNTNAKLTVVTQFVTSGNTLSEIRRLYVQNGRTISNSRVNIPGIDPVNSISDRFCSQQKSVFQDQNAQAQKGGLSNFSQALSRGMTLVLSLWDDHAANMLWLDSSYPPDRSTSAPGVRRGTCPTDSGKPRDVESRYPGSSVTYSNIRFGDIGSTY